MRKLIILAHPNIKSLNTAIANSYRDGALTKGHTVETIDLYRDFTWGYLNFDQWRSEQLTPRQQKIAAADQLIFVFPIRRIDAPAIMKNFIDTQLTHGFAFRQEGNRSIWLLKGKSVRIITTSGGPARLYKLPFWIVWGKGRIEFCGMKLIQTTIIGKVMQLSPPKIAKRLGDIYEMGIRD